MGRIHVFAFIWIAASEFLQKIGANMLNVSNYHETDGSTDRLKKERNIKTFVERKMREKFEKLRMFW